MNGIDDIGVYLLKLTAEKPAQRTNREFIRAIIRNQYNQAVETSVVKPFIKLDMTDDKIVDFICQAFADVSQCVSCPFSNYSALDCEKHLREFFYRTYDPEDIVMKTIVQTMFL